MTFIANLTREGKFWLITIPGVGVTQALNLKEAQVMAVDLVEIVTEEHDPDVELVLDASLRTAIEDVKQRQTKLEKAQKVYSAHLRGSVATLVKAGLTGADIAKVLGLSPQRVSQLTAEAASSRRVAKPVKVKAAASRRASPQRRTRTATKRGADKRTSD